MLPSGSFAWQKAGVAQVDLFGGIGSNLFRQNPYPFYDQLRSMDRVLIGTLLRRLPQVALATEEELEYRGNITLRGLKALPVNL